jgi:hypothetical protein
MGDQSTVGRSSLIAPEAETSWYEGAGMVESVAGLTEGITGGDVGAIVGNGVATGLGLLGAVMDPLQAVFAAGVGWLMEHVWFLREPLDHLLGDPKEIQGHADTWRNIQRRVHESVEFFVDEVKSSTAEWETTMAHAYKVKAKGHAEGVRALGGSCEFMAKITMVAGAVVGVVRNTIRDIVAEVIGACISKAVQALLVVTIPKIVAEVAVLVAECTAKISRLISKLTAAIGKLTKDLGALGELVGKLAKTFDSAFRGSARGATTLAGYRTEAALSRIATPADSIKDYGKAYADAFKTVSTGHAAVHGSTGGIVREVTKGSPKSNAAQNAGGTADHWDGGDPPPIDLPL